jgi:hypothetical protein
MTTKEPINASFILKDTGLEPIEDIKQMENNDFTQN